MYSGSLCRQHLQTWQSCAGIAEAAVHVDSMVAQESVENQLTQLASLLGKDKCFEDRSLVFS